MDSLSGPTQLQNFQSGEVTSCDLSINYLLAIGSSDKSIRVLEWKKGLGFVDVFYSPLSYHKYSVTSVRFSPSGTMLASSSLDGTAVLINVFTGTKIFIMVQYNTSDIRYCEFMLDSTKLITAAADGLLCFWDLVHHREISHYRLHEDDYSLRALAISPDSEYLLSIDSGNLMKLWFMGNIMTNQPQHLLNKKDTDDVLCCDFSSIKKITGNFPILNFNYCIVTCNVEKLIKVWDVIISRGPNHEKYLKCDLVLLHRLKHESDIVSARFSFCGKYLVSTGMDNLVKLWQVKDGRVLKTLHGHKRFATCAAFSKDSILLATGSIDKTLIIWDLSQNLTLDDKLLISCNVSCHFAHFNVKNYPVDNAESQTKKYNEFNILQKLTFSSAINSVQFQGNEILAIAGRNKAVGIWTKQTDKIIYKQKEILKEHEYSVNYLDILPCGSKIISCSVDGMIFWDLHMNLTYRMKTPSCTRSLRICKFSPDLKFIAAAGDDQKVYLWDTNNLEFIKITQEHENAVTAVAFTPDGKFLVSTCSGGDMVLQNLQKEECAITIKHCHDLGVICCDFYSTTVSESTNSHMNLTDRENSEVYLLATGGNDSLVKMWSVAASEITILKVLSGHGGSVNCVKFSTVEPFILASCSSDTTVRIWDVKTKYCLHVLNYHTSAVTTCSFSKTSTLLATGSLDKSVLILGLTERSYHEPKEPTENCNILFDNWTTSDLVKWFLDTDCPEIADDIRKKQINRRKLNFNDNSTLDFVQLVNEREKRKLKHKILLLKSLSFSSNILPKSKNVPHKFLCPITHCVMKDPVICSDGYVYERAALTEWFLGGKLISPITKECLTTTKLLPYSRLKRAIYEFLVENENEFLK